MRFHLLYAGTFALVLVLSGCASDPRPRGRFAQGPADPDSRPFVSPAGEVFRPAPGGERPLQIWFRQADTDGDGALAFAEMRADFARAFATFDVDGDGEIEPAEVTRYETEIFPEMATRGGGAGAGPSQGRRGGMGRGRGGMGPGGGMRRGGARGGGEGPGARMMMSGAARFGLLPIAHPIMEADGDMNRGVTRAEFDAAAGRRFQMLAGTTGRIQLSDLMARRANREGRGAQPRQGD